jgi:hypothetical protein
MECNMHRKNYRTAGNLIGKCHVGDQGIGRSIILKCVLEK